MGSAALDMDAAKRWIINEHLGRRNFNDESKSYWRGEQHEYMKQEHGGDRKSSGNNCPLKISQILAKEHKVSERTIRNDVQFARADDGIAPAAGEDAKAAILAGEVKITRQEFRSAE